MNGDDMRFDHRYEPSASITDAQYMHNDVLYHGKLHSDSSVRLPLHNSVSRKEKSSIFSFLQRFRAKNKNLFEDVTSLPSSPRSTRVIRGPNNRWESVESVLSSATANSFAFIPPSQLRSVSKTPHLTRRPLDRNPDVQPVVARDSALFLRRKYNLLGSDASLYQHDEPNRQPAFKKLHRNSVGNVENLRWERWHEQELFASFRRPVKPVELARRPKSEFDISAERNQIRKVYCHRPGKGRAPQPPEQAPTKTLAKPVPSRKKRKAPSPPKLKKMEKKSVSESDDKPEEETKLEKPERTMCDKVEEGTMYNDSLKLERGQLRANKSSTVISGSIMTEASAPVSPKPWYKRSTTRGHKKSSLKSSDKKKTCEQLLDEWMLEAGLPRSSSFYDERKGNFPSSVEPNSKRRSQISMLANISELDREAAEIVKKERRRELEAATSMNDRFYDQSTAAGQNWDPFKSVDETTTSKRNTPRDLISILNAITNVTKITVNTSFFKENVGRSVSKQASTPEMKIRRANNTPETAKKSNKLTITELEDFDEELKMKSANKNKPVEKTLDPVIPEVKPKPAEKTKEPMKPVKPFSSWMCPQCTLENPSWKFICEACNKWRPYSVTKVGGTTTPLITPKEDIKLHAENSNRVSTAEERNEISKISQNIRKQVYDILTSGETVRNNLSKLKIGEDYKRVATTAKESKPSQLDSLQHTAIADKIDENIEEIRKARLVFFSKNCLNDLNLKMAEPTKKSPPMNVKGIAEKNKYYNEEDRKKLREILKELRDSLPKDGLIEVSRLDSRKWNLEGLGSRSVSNETNAEIENEKLENREPNSGTGVDTVAEQTNSLKANSPLETEVKMTQPGSDNVDEWAANIQEAKKKVKTLEKPLTSTIEVASSSKIDLESPKKSDSYLPVKVDGTSEALPKQPSDLKHLSDLTNSNLNFKENKSATSLAVNRLLKKLQTAIASGQHHEAANIARELARLKVNCNMTRQDTPDIVSSEHQPPTVTVNLHIQKNLIQQTPAILKLSPAITLNDLKMKVFKEQDIPVQQQHWMLNGKLVPNEGATLEQMSLGVPEISLSVNSTVTENRASSFTAEDKFLNQENQSVNTSELGAEEEPVIQLTGIIKKILSSPTDSSHFEDTTRTGHAKSTETPKPEKPDTILNHTIESAVSKQENNVIVNSDKSVDKNWTVSARRDAEVDMNANLPELKSEASSSNSEWKCPRCTLINPVKVKNCAACDERIDSQATIVFLNEAGPSHRNDDNVALKLANYQELINMEMADIITNTANFECSVCLSDYLPGTGVILKDCLHTFCRECLIQTVQYSSEAEVKCPFRDNDYSCDSALQEREIKALVSAEVYEQHLARSVAEAENKIQNTFHCKTVNCQGWCIFEDNVNEFHCPVCSKTNCLTCQVIHAGLNCKQYQEVINKDAETNADANRTRMMLQEMLQKGEALTCPTCQIILMKKWGCDWLRCSMCKTEICWVTRGPRWGPKGKGDTTAGCQCGVKGVKCHPRCTYCH